LKDFEYVIQLHRLFLIVFRQSQWKACHLLRTKDTIKFKLDVDWVRTKDDIVKRIGEMFHEYPYYFFTERDIHSLLCDIANEELRLCGVEPSKTSDGYEVSFVHHEYPTPFRCDMEGDKFEKKEEPPFKRGHYDLVMLNLDFVKNNSLDIVSSKNFETLTTAMENVNVAPLIWACEIVFFPKMNNIPSNADRPINQDSLKVKETLRHKVGSENIGYFKMGSTLVFTSHTAKEASILAQKVEQIRQALRLDILLFTA